MITEIEHPDGTRLVPFEGGWKVETILEKNKWYKNKEYKNLVFYHSNNNDNYGFTFHTKKWSNDLWFELDSTWFSASEEEVKEALIGEAKRRGFNTGVKFKSPYREHSVWTHGVVDKIAFDLELTKGFETSLHSNNRYIFCEGKWAEIISNPNEKVLERIATIEKELEQLKSELR